MVRVADVDDTGAALNLYTGRARLDGPVPERPWAVYLAEQAGAEGPRFRLLAFDLDAKGDPAAAQRDADVLAGVLDDAGVPHVLCRSGPSDGRHLWVGLNDGVDAATVATLARLARHVCPSLDLAPLTNPVTGCVRPPGAPHRDGGTSQVLRGDLGTLTASSTTPEQVRALVSRLAQLVDDTEPAHDPAARTPLPVDRHGHLYLPGARRALPAVSAAALQADAAVGDASAVAWTVLIGAASARWHHDDVAALVPTSPGLEHVRTLRQGPTRRPRPARGPASAAMVLRRQWHKAVQHVATTARQVGADPTFDARADAITAAVRAVQERADATAGRWGTRTGPTDRRVLDVLCTLALQAVSADVEADTRRVALLAGIGRETARTGLLRLAAERWIALSQAASGPHGARWTLTPRATPPVTSPDAVSPATAPLAAVPPGAVHRKVTTNRSQGDPRPAGAGPAERLTLLTDLTARTTAAAHDAFTTRPGLGHLVGNTWARLTHPMSTIDLARITAHPVDELQVVLGRLADAGLLVRAGDTWSRPARDHRDLRDVVAVARGAAGVLLERERRYRVERVAWAWWQAEHAWMLAPRRAHPARRAGTGQLDLLAEPGTTTLGAHPRRPDGRADFRAARAIVAAAGITDRSPAGEPQQAARDAGRRRAA
ncbi:hypothetical protein [Aquipuribacter hungaricus]|uniref:Uncharacterized protein n=1 Tax=Aquipuribacter hungaricus TaxID=545624 RepID=A0ABV7WJF2_9MICO